MGSKSENLGLYFGLSTYLAVWSWASHSLHFLVCKTGNMIPEISSLWILKSIKTFLCTLNNVFPFLCGWNGGKKIRKIINLNEIHLYFAITLEFRVYISRFRLFFSSVSEGFCFFFFLFSSLWKSAWSSPWVLTVLNNQEGSWPCEPRSATEVPGLSSALISRQHAERNNKEPE